MAIAATLPWLALELALVVGADDDEDCGGDEDEGATELEGLAGVTTGEAKGPGLMFDDILLV